MNPFKAIPGRKFKRAKNAVDTSIVDIIPGNPTKFKCKVCFKVFKTRRNISYHQYHDGQKPLICGMCNKGFVSVSHFRYHQLKHTGNLHHNCEFCQRKFVNKTELKAHLKSHGVGNKYRCTMCDKTFLYSTSLQIHIKVHTGERPHRCNTCNSCFASKPILRKHEQIHSAIRNFLCEFCGKTFKIKTILDSHVSSVHDNKRDYACNACPAAFTSRKDLLRHVNIHEGLKAFKCTSCGSTFGRKDNCMRHMRTRCKVSLENISAAIEVRNPHVSNDKNEEECEGIIDVVGI